MLAELARRHRTATFLGIDVDPGMVEHAQREHAAENVRFELADLAGTRIDFTADFAYSVDVLHHVREPLPFLRGVRSLLRTGGVWLVFEPNVFHPYMLWSQGRMRRAGFDEDHFRPWVTEPQLREAGFEVRERRYAFFFPGWIERVPRGVAWIEPALERVRPFGASVVYRLLKTP
jgi:SAM-dependent methyltransferase